MYTKIFSSQRKWLCRGAVRSRHLLFFLSVLTVLHFTPGCGTHIKVMENARIEKPQLISKVELEYPEEAKNRGLEGKVGLFLLIDTTGNVRQVRVSSPSQYDFFNEAAAEYAKKLKFKPAMKDGKPTAVWFSLDIKFSMFMD